MCSISFLLWFIAKWDRLQSLEKRLQQSLANSVACSVLQNGVVLWNYVWYISRTDNSIVKALYPHLCQVDTSISIVWKAPFPTGGGSDHIYYCPPLWKFPYLMKNDADPDQTSRSAVYIVCQCPFYGTLGVNGLNSAKQKCWELFHLCVVVLCLPIMEMYCFF